MRLPPAPMMYSAIWLTSATSECRRSRMTAFTASMSAAIDWARAFWCGVGRAADKAYLRKTWIAWIIRQAATGDALLMRGGGGKTRASRACANGLYVADIPRTGGLVNGFDRIYRFMYNLRFPWVSASHRNIARGDSVEILSNI